MLRLNVKLREVLLLRLRATFHTMPLFYLRTLFLRTYARKNYVTVEINSNAGYLTLRFYDLTDSATKKLDELFEIISNSLAGNDECKDTDLPGDCTITSDCLKITCNAHFGGKTITLTVKVNR